MTLGLEISGLTELVTELQGIEAIMPTLQTVVRDTAKMVFDESQRLVPVDTGLLRGSGYMVENLGGLNLSIEIGYSAPYALYVHEDLGTHHASPTCAKYLEIPITQHQKGLLTAINAVINDFIRRK